VYNAMAIGAKQRQVIKARIASRYERMQWLRVMHLDEAFAALALVPLEIKSAGLAYELSIRSHCLTLLGVHE
jgi:hypothetical protein